MAYQRPQGAMRNALTLCAFLTVLALSSRSQTHYNDPTMPTAESLQKAVPQLLDRLKSSGVDTGALSKRIDKDVDRDLGCPQHNCEPLTEDMIVSYFRDNVLPLVLAESDKRKLTSSVYFETQLPGAVVRWQAVGKRDGGLTRSTQSRTAYERQGIRQSLMFEIVMGDSKKKQTTKLDFDPLQAQTGKAPTDFTEDLPIGIYYVWTEREGRVTSDPYAFFSIVNPKERIKVSEWQRSKGR